MIDDGHLDAMLSAPLDDVADNGFSLHVAHVIERRQSWQEQLTWGVPLFAAALAAPFLPLQELGETFTRLGPAIAGSAALSLALAALILTISFEQRYRDWDAGAL
jgi:hypothetical protein